MILMAEAKPRLFNMRSEGFFFRGRGQYPIFCTPGQIESIEQRTNFEKKKMSQDIDLNVEFPNQVSTIRIDFFSDLYFGILFFLFVFNFLALFCMFTELSLGFYAKFYTKSC